MTPKLGDFFPDKSKEDFAERIVQPGAVFRIFTSDTNPPKIKRFIILEIEKGTLCVAALYINKEININVFPTRELQRLHHPILSINANYLDHDSFIDCSQIYETQVATFKDKFLDDSEVHLGDLSAQDLTACQKLTASARTISIALKRKFKLV